MTLWYLDQVWAAQTAGRQASVYRAVAEQSAWSRGEEPEHCARRLTLAGTLLQFYICNFHGLSHLLLIYTCKLHWICARGLTLAGAAVGYEPPLRQPVDRRDDAQIDPRRWWREDPSIFSGHAETTSENGGILSIIQPMASTI